MLRWGNRNVWRALAVALFAGFAAGAAAQQSTLAFDARPDGQAFANNYPDLALINDQVGAVILCCRVKPDRSLDCVVDREWPAEAGFGAASLEVAKSFRVTPKSLTDSMAIGNP
jgi:hypothetical protein